jgi:hypothetical protein
MVRRLLWISHMGCLAGCVSENLETLAEQHPFQPPPAKGAPEETLADPEGADPLMDAAAAERKGLAALGAVIQAI